MTARPWILSCPPTIVQVFKQQGSGQQQSGHVGVCHDTEQCYVTHNSVRFSRSSDSIEKCRQEHDAIHAIHNRVFEGNKIAEKYERFLNSGKGGKQADCQIDGSPYGRYDPKHCSRVMREPGRKPEKEIPQPGMPFVVNLLKELVERRTCRRDTPCIELIEEQGVMRQVDPVNGKKWQG